MLKNIGDRDRNSWLRLALAALPKGARLLDAGAGELKNRKYCGHLEYVSHDFCQYRGGGEQINEGLWPDNWDISRIDLIGDITAIPAPDATFDAVLCSEVLEHVPEPTHALDEFSRLLKPGGVLILTAPFASIVHMAPYYFSSGFSKYWYQHHLERRGFQIQSLEPNGDWFALLRQEITRLGGLERQRGNWVWPIAYVYSLLGLGYFALRADRSAKDLACIGWQCVAVKQQESASREVCCQ